MSFEPQKWFIGLTDFFAIILPGALLTYVLKVDVGPALLGAPFANTVERATGAQGWAIFLFASYVFGHLIVAISSWFDELYDRARRHTVNNQIARVARHGRPLPRFFRWLVWLVFRDERDRAVRAAGDIKRQMLGSVQAADAINTYQWSKALLGATSPSSLAIVQRFEADSKFFRSFSMVMLLCFFWYWRQVGLVSVIPVGLVFVLAFWRYWEQRFKATNQAYWSVLTLTALEGKITVPRPVLPSRPTHAGGVVYRLHDGAAEYLLVEATDNPSQLVLPKGHVEAGESRRETAVREVLEEAGVWAKIDADLGEHAWVVGRSVITVQCYVMRAVGSGKAKDRNREHRWLPLAKALEQAGHDETRRLLELGEQRRGKV